jgi:hypothetical protein
VLALRKTWAQDFMNGDPAGSEAHLDGTSGTTPGGKSRSLLFHLLAALLVCSLTGTAGAATINVGGGCTLADAIASANGDTAVGSCAAGTSGPDTLVLTADVTLSSVDNTGSHGPNGLPVVTSEMTIEGNGFHIARDPMGPSFRLFEVASTGHLRLEDTTLENGSIVGSAGSSGNNSFVSGGTGGAGTSGDDAEGGAIYNAGALELVQVVLAGNSVTGGSGGQGGNGGGGVPTGGPGGLGGNGGNARGGAIYSSGTVYATESTLNANLATGGTGGQGGAGGASGLIEVVAGSFYRGGDGGDGGAGGAGGYGRGGGIYLSAAGTLSVFRGLASANTVVGGVGGLGGDGESATQGLSTSGLDDADGGDGGYGGAGGAGGTAAGAAVFSEATLATVTESALRAGIATGGTGGAGGTGSDGGRGVGVGDGGDAGDGGAAGAGGSANGSAMSGVGRLERSEVSGGMTTGGSGGNGGTGGDKGGAQTSNLLGAVGGGGDGGGGGLAGGAVSADGGTLAIANSTVSGNTANGGTGGTGGDATTSVQLIGVGLRPSGDGGDGGDAQGSGVSVAAASNAAISNSTIADNTATGGPGGAGGTCEEWCGGDGNPGAAGVVEGAGVRGEATLLGSLVSANNGGDQCAGTVSSQGGNLASDASCNLDQAGDQPNDGGVNLQALADNGGPTLPGGGAPLTHALGGGSTAIDNGACGSPPLTIDQRRFSRDASCDTGAFESASSEFTDLPTVNLSIDATSQLEGNSGTTDRTLTLTLSLESASTVTVDLGVGGTATAGSDYVDPSGQVSFFPGTTVTTITVPINGDTDLEATETATFTLSNPSGATIDTGSVDLEIVNDDGPRVTIADASVVEGDAGPVLMMFTLTLDAPAPAGASVVYRTIDDDATTGDDYVGVEDTFNIPMGVTVAMIEISVTGDTLPEFDETFELELSNPANVALEMGGNLAVTISATGTILDDDQAFISLDVLSTGGGTRFSEAECLPDGGAKVASLDDGADNLTLREAICIANNTRLDDVITLPASATITLDEVDNRWYGPNGLPPIAGAITVDGQGATIERDPGAPAFRFFLVPRQNLTDALEDGSLTLVDLTLRGGLAKGGSSRFGGGGAGMGGAVFNQSTLHIEGVTLDANTAEGGDSGVMTLGAGGGGIGEDATGFHGGGFGAPGPINGKYGGGVGELMPDLWAAVVPGSASPTAASRPPFLPTDRAGPAAVREPRAVAAVFRQARITPARPEMAAAVAGALFPVASEATAVVSASAVASPALPSKRAAVVASAAAAVRAASG